MSPLTAIRKNSREDLYNMEDEEYRDYMRGHLIKARKELGRSNRAGSSLITVILLVAIALIALHEGGIIKLIP